MPPEAAAQTDTTTAAPAATTQAADTGGTNTSTTTTEAGNVADTKSEPVSRADQITTKTDTATTTEAEPFVLPDAYKDKPWATKIKTQEDLYKQIDNLNTAVGKKTVVPDFEKAAPEEIEAYKALTRPADVSAYDFGDADPTFTAPVAQLLHKEGVHPKIANEIIKGYQAHEAAVMADLTSADGFKEVMTAAFGEKMNEQVSAISKAHKAMLPKESLAVLEAVPNAFLGVVYDLSAKYEAKIAKMKEEYGITEDVDVTGGNNGSPTGKSLDEQRSTIRQQMRDLDRRPHTADEKAKLQSQLDALYK